MRKAGTLYYLFTDHLGSTSVTYNTATSQTQTLRYYPWGSVRSGDVPTDRRFTGQRWDATIELYDYQARWYDAGLGRFVQPDPIVSQPGNPQDLNRYSYVRNNPLEYVDPNGQCPAPAKGSGSAICIAWFIPMKDALFLKGDDREFSTDSDPSKSRAYIHLYLEDSTIRAKVVVNPSTLLLPGGELRRAPHEVYVNEGESISIQLKRAALGLGNEVNIHYEQDEIRIGFDLNQSATYISPAGVNGQIELTKRDGKWVSAGERDRFPALEMYYYEDGEVRQTIYQGEPHSRNWFWGPFGGLVPVFPNERWDHISSTQQSGLRWALATKVQ